MHRRIFLLCAAFMFSSIALQANNYDQHVYMLHVTDVQPFETVPKAAWSFLGLLPELMYALHSDGKVDVKPVKEMQNYRYAILERLTHLKPSIDGSEVSFILAGNIELSENSVIFIPLDEAEEKAASLHSKIVYYNTEICTLNEAIENFVRENDMIRFKYVCPGLNKQNLPSNKIINSFLDSSPLTAPVARTVRMTNDQMMNYLSTGVIDFIYVCWELTIEHLNVKMLPFTISVGDENFLSLLLEGRPELTDRDRLELISYFVRIHKLETLLFSKYGWKRLRDLLFT